MSARIIEVNSKQYHSDPCKTPSLSASIAHTLNSKSALHAYTQHPKLGGIPEEPTDFTDSGAIVHALVLGEGAQIAVCGPYHTKTGALSESWMTAEARAEKEAVIAAGRIPVLWTKMPEYEAIAKAITERLDEKEIDFPGRVECVIEWEETASDGEPVLCRCAMDHVLIDSGVIDDFKTSAVSVHPRILGRWADTYGWAIKNAAYVSALEHLKPELTGRVKPIRFVCAETKPPYDVVAGRLDGTFRAIGERNWKRAVDVWAKCLRTKSWPGYCPGDVIIEAPGWLLSQAMELEAAVQNDDLEAWKDGQENASF